MNRKNDSKEKDIEINTEELNEEKATSNPYEEEVEFDNALFGFDKRQVMNYIFALSKEYKQMYDAYQQLEEEVEYYRKHKETIADVLLDAQIRANSTLHRAGMLKKDIDWKPLRELKEHPAPKQTFEEETEDSVEIT